MRQPPMASGRGDVQSVRPSRAGSLKEGERIALAISAATARYRSLSRTGKQRLLDELQALTGYHRKSLLREVVWFFWTGPIVNLEAGYRP